MPSRAPKYAGTLIVLPVVPFDSGDSPVKSKSKRGRMLTREIQLDTHSGPVTLNPRWLRIPVAVKYSGLSRSRPYELLSKGRIRSICVKSQKWAQCGVRLIDRESIDAFMEDQASAFEPRQMQA